MKAERIFFPAPGRAELREVDVPEPGAGEVQVRCVANGICMYEVSMFAWHHTPRRLKLGPWHLRGLKVLNTALGIGTDYNLSYLDRAVRLLEKGTFDMTKLITHRWPAAKAQEAMEVSAARSAGYIKGVFLFED